MADAGVTVGIRDAATDDYWSQKIRLGRIGLLDQTFIK
jgi:hypothetical protein